jgi:hypothetical protein
MLAQKVDGLSNISGLEDLETFLQGKPQLRPESDVILCEKNGFHEWLSRTLV